MSSQSLHIDVKGNTPLRIHLKKANNKSSHKIKQTKSTQARKPKRKVSLNAKKIVDTSSKPSWLKKTKFEVARSNKYGWDSSKALLEINKPCVELNVRDPNFGILRQRDVLREANERMKDHVRDYDIKIKGLMNEVGTLKNETRHLSCQIYERNLLKSAELRLEEEKIKSMQDPPIEPNRHLKCYKEPKVYNPVEERAKKTLAKMLSSAKKEVLIDETDADAAYSDSVTKNVEVVTEETVVAEDEDEMASPVQESTRIHSKEADFPEIVSIGETSLSEELATRRGDLQIAKADFEEKRRELEEVVDELEEVDKQKICLLESMHDYKEELSRNVNYFEEKSSAGDALPCQLLALEMSGNHARKQVAALRDVILRLRHDALSGSDVNALNNQRLLLIQKLKHFDVSNQTTRKLILAEEKIVSTCVNLRKHIDLLMQKISESSNTIVGMQSQISDKEAIIQQCNAELQDLQKEVSRLDGANLRYNGTSSHLQNHIVEKEMENEQLLQLVQQARVDFEALRSKNKMPCAESNEDWDIEEKELREEMGWQHCRAKKAEEAMIKAEKRMERQELELKELAAQAQMFKQRCMGIANAESALEDQAKSLEKKLAETMKIHSSLQNLESQIQEANEEHFSIKSEIQRCKRSRQSSEQRCLMIQDEVTVLLEEMRKCKLSQQQLVAEIRQVPEIEEALCKCTNDQGQVMSAESLIELDELSESMLEKLKHLKPMPVQLRKTEVSLQEALGKLALNNQKSIERTKLILNLMQKDAKNKEDEAKLQKDVSSLVDKNSTLLSRVNALTGHLDHRNNSVQQSKISADEIDFKIKEMQNQLNRSILERNRLNGLLKSVEMDRRNAVNAEISKGVTQNRLDQSRISDLKLQLDRLKFDEDSLSKSKHDFEKESYHQLEEVEQRLARTLVANSCLKEKVSYIKTSLTKLPDYYEKELDFSGPKMTASGAYLYN